MAACQTVDIPYVRDGELPTPVVVAEASPERRAPNAQVFDAVTDWVDRLNYDPRMGGRDWSDLTARYRAEAVVQPTEADFYRRLEQTLDELDDRHTNVTAPSSRAVDSRREAEEKTVGFGLSVVRGARSTSWSGCGPTRRRRRLESRSAGGSRPLTDWSPAGRWSRRRPAASLASALSPS